MSKQAGVSIGMMDQAYFVGRKAILQWLNDLLLTDFKKVEETANGKFFFLFLVSLSRFHQQIIINDQQVQQHVKYLISCSMVKFP